jgi:hypothetical protein
VAGANRFQDLTCYQLASELRTRVAEAVESTGIARDRDLADQLRRAARSVTGNIAEGFASRSHAEFARFLTISKPTTFAKPPDARISLVPHRSTHPSHQRTGRTRT